MRTPRAHGGVALFIESPHRQHKVLVPIGGMADHPRDAQVVIVFAEGSDIEEDLTCLAKQSIEWKHSPFPLHSCVQISSVRGEQNGVDVSICSC